MIYNATVKSNFGMFAISVPICGFFIVFGAMHKQIAMVVLGAVPLIWLLAIRLRLRVIVTDDHLEYRGLLSTKQLRFTDVTDCRPMVSLGYLAEKLYGPFTYRIQTSDESIKINFKFFPLECMVSVLSKIQSKSE